MAKLDATIVRLKALPNTEQEAVAARIVLLLDHGTEDLLTPEQWADGARLDSIPH